MKIINTLLLFSTFMISSSYLASSATGNSAASAVKPIVHTLDNGLTIIVKEDNSAPVASVQIWCKTGSIHEGEWLGAGLSHILEHMLFKGTSNRDGKEIALTIQQQGGYINAYTSFDRTVYWADTPSAGVDEIIDVLSDSILNSTLPEDEYVKEQEVIRREFAMGFDSPERTGQKLLFETAFSEHPYRMPIIGYLDVYNQLTRDDVFAYYKKRYVPNNLFYVIVGDVDSEAVINQITEIFKDVPRSKFPPVLIDEEPRQLGKRIRHEEFPSELSRLSVAWKIPGVTHQDMPALDVLAAIMGDGRSSRLYQSIRMEQALAHSISAFAYTPKGMGLFTVMATSDPDKRPALEQAIFQQVEAIQQQGVTAAELDKAKKRILSSQYAEMKTMSGKASDLGSNWLLARNLNLTDYYLDAVGKVKVDDVKRVANKYLVDQGLTITSLNPPDFVESVADADSDKVDTAPEIKKFDLSNGATLLVREDSRLPLVSGMATFKAGVLAEEREQSGLSTLVASSMLKGTKNRSASEIAGEIEAVGGSISSESGMNSLSARVETMSDDWQLGLEILADVVINPSFPEAVVQREKDVQIAAIKNEMEQPVRKAANLLRANLYGDHPYSKPRLGTLDSVAGFTTDDLVGFHSRIATADNCVIAVFGDVKAEDVRNFVEQQFVKLPKSSDARPTPPDVVDLDSNSLVRRHIDKEQAVMMIGYLGPTISDPERLALEVINEASSDLGSRFFERIREQLGLAYFVGSSMSPGLARGLFGFYLGTDPAKTDLVEQALLDEIKKLAENGLSEDEFQRAKAKLVGQQKIRLQANDDFAQLVALNELYGLGYNFHEKEITRLESLTLDEVNAVASKYFADQNHVNVLVSPSIDASAAAVADNPKVESTN